MINAISVFSPKSVYKNPKIQQLKAQKSIQDKSDVSFKGPISVTGEAIGIVVGAVGALILGGQLLLQKGLSFEEAAVCASMIIGGAIVTVLSHVSGLSNSHA